eukprot:scaffold240674_cov31-Tisochrysis_lutea.AAC.2
MEMGKERRSWPWNRFWSFSRWFGQLGGIGASAGRATLCWRSSIKPCHSLHEARCFCIAAATHLSRNVGEAEVRRDLPVPLTTQLVEQGGPFARHVRIQRLVAQVADSLRELSAAKVVERQVILMGGAHAPQVEQLHAAIFPRLFPTAVHLIQVALLMAEAEHRRWAKLVEGAPELRERLEDDGVRV